MGLFGGRFAGESIFGGSSRGGFSGNNSLSIGSKRGFTGDVLSGRWK